MFANRFNLFVLLIITIIIIKQITCIPTKKSDSIVDGNHGLDKLIENLNDINSKKNTQSDDSDDDDDDSHSHEKISKSNEKQKFKQLRHKNLEQLSD
jgi:hypothetical protein